MSPMCCEANALGYRAEMKIMEPIAKVVSPVKTGVQGMAAKKIGRMNRQPFF